MVPLYISAFCSIWHTDVQNWDCRIHVICFSSSTTGHRNNVYPTSHEYINGFHDPDKPPSTDQDHSSSADHKDEGKPVVVVTSLAVWASGFILCVSLPVCLFLYPSIHTYTYMISFFTCLFATHLKVFSLIHSLWLFSQCNHLFVFNINGDIGCDFRNCKPCFCVYFREAFLIIFLCVDPLWKFGKTYRPFFYP